MEVLQRSTTSFRRQGSSGLVWDDRFLSGELNKIDNKEIGEQNQQHRHGLPIATTSSVQRSRSSSGGGYRAGKVTPAEIDPPSPKFSACGFCGAFGIIAEIKGQGSKAAAPRIKHRPPR